MAHHDVENAYIHEHRVHASSQRLPDWFIDKEITLWLHNHPLGLQKCVKRNTCSSITKVETKSTYILITKEKTEEYMSFDYKSGKQKYMYSDYKRENRRVHVFWLQKWETKVHVFYPIRLLLEVSPPLHLFFHMSFSASASFFSRLSCWFSDISVSSWPST